MVVLDSLQEMDVHYKNKRLSTFKSTPKKPVTAAPKPLAAA